MQASPRCIRQRAADEMCAVFWFHIRLMAIFTGMCAITPPMAGLVFVLFATFFNAVCLAERFWDIQIRTLVYWSPWIQCVFLVSRLALVTISVIMAALLIRVCFVLE